MPVLVALIDIIAAISAKMFTAPCRLRLRYAAAYYAIRRFRRLYAIRCQLHCLCHYLRCSCLICHGYVIFAALLMQKIFRQRHVLVYYTFCRFDNTPLLRRTPQYATGVTLILFRLIPPRLPRRAALMLLASWRFYIALYDAFICLAAFSEAADYLHTRLSMLITLAYACWLPSLIFGELLSDAADTRATICHYATP